MAFRDDVDAETRQGGVEPRLYQVLRELAPDLRAEVMDAIDDHSLSGGAIARALARRGIRLHEAQVHKHRRQGRTWPDDLR